MFKSLFTSRATQPKYKNIVFLQFLHFHFPLVSGSTEALDPHLGGCVGLDDPKEASYKVGPNSGSNKWVWVETENKRELKV